MSEASGAYEVIPAEKHSQLKRASSLQRLKICERSPTPPPLPPRYHTLGHDQQPLSLSPEVAPLSPCRILSSSQMKAAVKKSLSMTALCHIENDSTELSDFVSRYSNLLPVSVKVLNGYCSNVSDLSISRNERFNLHFVKHTKVVALRDCKYLEEYSIPLNSSLEFGLLYNPHLNEEDALAGFQFKTVGEMAAMKLLPLVVRAKQDYKGSSAESSVEAGELLIIEAVIKSSFPGRGKVMKVQSVGHGKKLLSEKCVGWFSTKPEDVRLELSDLLRCSIPLPQKAMLFASQGVDQLLPSYMVTAPVVLEKIKGETSLIATAIHETDYQAGPLIDISSELSVQIELIPLSESEKATLVKSTTIVYDTYDSSRLQPLIEKSCGRAYNLQSLFYKNVVRNRMMDGTHLVWPTVMHLEMHVARERSVTDTRSAFLFNYHDDDDITEKKQRSASEPFGSHFRLRDRTPSFTSDSSVSVGITHNSPLKAISTSSSSSSNSHCSHSDDGLSETPMPEWFDRHHESPYRVVSENRGDSEVRSQEGAQESVDSEYIHMMPEIKGRKTQLEIGNMKSHLDSLDSRYRVLESHVMHSMHQVEELTGRFDRLEQTIEALKQQPPTEQPSTQPHAVKDDEIMSISAASSPSRERPGAQENRKQLAALDCDQICDLLDAMGLPQYKEVFKTEQVSGDVLVECDDKVLGAELAVSLRIHRIRLLSLISGKTSIESILQ